MSLSIGSIALDLVANTTGFQRQLNNLGNTGTGVLRGMQNSFNRFGNSMRNTSMFSSQNKSVSDYNAKIQQTKAEIAQLTALMQQMKNQPVTNPTIENLKNNINKTQTEIQKTTELIRNIGTQPVTSPAIKKLKENIHKTETEIQRLNNLMLNIGSQTGDAKAMLKFSTQIDNAKNKLSELENQKKALLNAGANSSDESLKNLNREIKRTENAIIRYKQKLDEASKVKGVDTSAYISAQNQINKLNSKLAEYRQKLDETSKAKINSDYSNAQRNLNILNSTLDTYRRNLNEARKAESSQRAERFNEIAERINSANIRLREYNRQLLQTSSSSKICNTGINSVISSLNRLGSTVGIAFSTVAVVNFGKSCVQTASQITNAVTGLKSIVEGVKLCT